MSDPERTEPDANPARDPPERRAALWIAPLLGFVCFSLVGAALAAVAPRVGWFAPPIDQPIAFNHRLHNQDLGLECSECHVYFETEAFSGLPDADTCATCHAEAQGDSAEEARLVRMLEAGRTPEWRPLFRQPAHVFYSHRRHVVAGGIECPVCHGTIAETTTPPTRVRRLDMATCVGCHQRSGVSTACTTCHR